jgi:hypothetical protein
MVPQLIYLALFCAGVGMCLVRHGQPKRGEHDAFVDIIAGGMILGILYWGGFFDCLIK